MKYLKTFSILFLVAFYLGLSLPALASVFAEPYVGLAKQEVHLSGAADIANGFVLGAKLGYSFSNKYYVAGDFMQGGPYSFGDLLDDSEMTNTLLGVGIGADYRIIRFWLGYYFDNEMTATPDSLKLLGTAIKGGFGLVASNKFRANLELVYHTMNTVEFAAATQTGSSDLLGFDFITTMVTLSVPVDFK